MKVFMFLYDDFSDFEITQLLLLFRDYSLTTVGFDKNYVKSIGQLKVLVDIPIEELDTREVNLFIIPGGEPKHFIANENYSEKISIFNQKLQEIASAKKLIAAICGGPTFLANAGILNNIESTASISDDEKIYYKNTIFTDTDLVIADNIITAKGQAFTEFAVAVAQVCELIKTTDEAQEAIDWFRNRKN
ncbi:MAG: hypothetical protein FK734_08920 [Asgard group archaeon]|nr:hypothetical protein [Asgard group archaeon]